MFWLRENWFWLVVAILFVTMHAGGHGGHGHGGHRRAAQRDDAAGTPGGDDADTDLTDAAAPPPRSHRH